MKAQIISGLITNSREPGGNTVNTRGLRLARSFLDQGRQLNHLWAASLPFVDHMLSSALHTRGCHYRIFRGISGSPYQGYRN